MDLKNKTPSKLVNKVLTGSFTCDSPFRLLPNISTPPSRLSKILNPFEPHLIERLHLPTFSPGVFAHVSTPKKFKWNIENISNLKPADIDEATLSQHVVEQDPTVESLVQEKIDRFFNEKSIVPSPLTEQVKRVPLLATPQHASTQTVLCLPPTLPPHLEEALKPYLHVEEETAGDGSLYRKLFEFDKSVESSPALSTGLSPIQFSPEFKPELFDSPIEMPELRDCTLSPIGRSSSDRSSREGRSACRLSFGRRMSLDASLVVPDVNHTLTTTSLEGHSLLPMEEVLSGASTSNNWDMEYKQVSILSRSPVSSPEVVDTSNSDTPRSRMFTSQRKRLSRSFKDEEQRDVEMEEDQKLGAKRLRNRARSVEDMTDGGYHTASVSMGDGSVHMFASTPTKNKN